MHGLRLLITLLASMSSFAVAGPCEFAPFTLNNGTPMPGMRDGRLDFQSAAICATLPTGLKGSISRAAFRGLQVRGTPVDDVVPLGGGLLAPCARMGCRSTAKFTNLLFEDGELLLTSSDGGLTAAMAAFPLINVWRNWMKVPKIPTGCRDSYEKALLHALFPRPESLNEEDMINIAATENDSCSSDDFRAPLRGIAARWMFTWSRTQFIWARVGDCLLTGLTHKPDQHTLSLRCPGMAGEAIVIIPPRLLPAFIGANSGMTADATIHPMDATCISAWDAWRAQGNAP